MKAEDVNRKNPFRPNSDREEFRPAIAMRRSLPAAIFWSLVVAARMGPVLEKLPGLAWLQSLADPFYFFVTMAVFGTITPLWSGLAIGYAVRCSGHHGVRWTFAALNIAAIVAWVIGIWKLLSSLSFPRC